MRKISVSTSLDDGIIERIAALQAKLLGTSQAIILRAAVDRGLSVLEAAILGPQFAGESATGRKQKEAA